MARNSNPQPKELEMLRRITLLIALAALAVPIAAFSSSSRVTASGNLFARVAGNGTLLGGSSGTSVSHTVTGQYEVTFSSDVSGCAYVATTLNAHTQAVTVFTAGGHNTGNGAPFASKNPGGGATHSPLAPPVQLANTRTPDRR